MRPQHRFALVLLVPYLLWSIALGIHPYDRGDWMLENGLVVIFVTVLIATAKRFPFSRVSYAMIFVFLSLHTLGAHYTYSLVPYNDWTQAIFGKTLNEMVGWKRNNFDRVIHFTYGLLMVYPTREIYLRIAQVRGFWGYFLPLDFMMSTSLIYELIEWAAAEVFGGELGEAYLGTQGDTWDAHKDMALASLGALIAMTIVAIINGSHRRDFGREWVESIRVKRMEPLGESELLDLSEDAQPRDDAS